MYVYYEHHRDADGKVLLTELRLSSKNNGTLQLHFFNPMEKMIFESCKAVLKWPPIANYSYEPSTFVWSYFGQYGVSGSYGEEVIKKLETVIKVLQQESPLIGVKDFVARISNNFINLSAAKFTSAEDFFYNHTAVSKPVLCGEVLKQKLIALLGAEPNKHSYRSAALRLHPDRNNGDASQMSELNMLWQLWNKENGVSK
jgi:hypothetical protein